MRHVLNRRLLFLKFVDFGVNVWGISQKIRPPYDTLPIRPLNEQRLSSFEEMKMPSTTFARLGIGDGEF